ncbi:FAD-dependent oxidoreductase [Alkalicoccus urumqiensis]|nr:FAD-dependent oxidoreductase [Alkalicoccus urumqiensis]
MDTSGLPQSTESYWLQAREKTGFPPLKEDIYADTAVIGGGLAGMMSAYELSRRGRDVVVLEARTLFEGTSGKTTAKLSSQHGLHYAKMLKMHGRKKARLYFEAQEEAIAAVERLAEAGASCDFERKEACIYAETYEGKRELEKEARAYHALGIPGIYEEVDSPSERVKAKLRLPDQAQFHPVRLMNWLAAEIEKNGGRLYEQTRVVKTKEGEAVRIDTESGAVVTADNCITASHIPFQDTAGMYFSRLEPERSYSIAVEADPSQVQQMLLGIDGEKVSLRTAWVDGREMILVGGQSHKPGTVASTETCYEALARYAYRELGASRIHWRWSAQDFTSLDDVPYIGRLTRWHKHTYTACGFKKWGMTGGIAAAFLLADLIEGRENRMKPVFDPARSSGPAAAGRLAKKLSGDGGWMFRSHLPDTPLTEELPEPGSGAVVRSGAGLAAVYRREDGGINSLSGACSHLYCGVTWNEAEKSWDCPCHGSRFNVEGEVLEGPAVKPLAKMKLDDGK